MTATDVPASGEPVRPRVSIVLPCLNGSAYLEASLARLFDHLHRRRESVGPTEVLFVDDGSTDRSAEIVRTRFPEVRVLQHTRNRGKGAAVRTGVQAARGSFVFFIDADVPYALTTLDTMLDYLDRKEFHICIGRRPRRQAEGAVEMGRVRRLASAIFTEFVSRIVVTGIRDTQCGIKGFRADIARNLFGQSRVDNFAFDVEILYLAYKNDLDVKRVPVRLTHHGDSSVSLLRHAPSMLLAILALPIRYHSGRYALRSAPEAETRSGDVA